MKSVFLRLSTGVLLYGLGPSAVLLAAKAAKPPPPFTENYGQLVAGQPVPDLTLQAADGSSVKLSTLIKGKTAVLSVWSVGTAGSFIDLQERLARKYANQGVQFIGLIAYSSRPSFDRLLKYHPASLSFPLVFDPAGQSPAPAKDFNTMNPGEKEAFIAVQRAHMSRVAPVIFTGGEVAQLPNTTVIDAQGRMLGFYVGAGGPAADALGNLLLRAGVRLALEDMPKKIYTAAETRPPPPPPPEAQVAMLRIGAPAPDFPATDAKGKAVRVSDFRGKIVILDFWATWCGPCVNSMPHTQEVAVRYKDQGVAVLACCTEDTREKFDAWVGKNRAKFPDMHFVHDPEERGPERASHQLYGVNGIPQQFIIGRDGRVAARCTGYLKGEVLLEAALAEAGVEVDPAIIAKSKLDLAHRSTLR